MRISPVGIYSQNNCDCKRKMNPNFNGIFFSHIAKKFITSDLLMLSVEERNKTLKNLERCMKQAAKAPKDIYVDAPEYLLGLVAKVPDSTKTGSTTNYGLKTFIQGAVNDFKFLEDAIKESNAVKY